MSEPFHATHTVPDGGLDVWAEPDPAQPSSAHLDAGVPVAITEQRGAWAHVVCDNGFTGWLGTATLQPLAVAAGVGAAAVLPGMPAAGYYAALYEAAERGPTASPAALALAEGARAGDKPASITAVGVGAALTILGCFLPWFSIGEVGITGYEIPLQFLLLKDSISGGLGGDFASNGPTVGLACLLASLVGVACSRRATTDKFRRVLGWVIVLLPTMAVGQVQLLLRDTSASFGDAGIAGAPGLLSTLGIGLLTTMIGGLVLALSPRATKDGGDAEHVAAPTGGQP